MPRMLRTDETRCAVQVLPWSLGNDGVRAQVVAVRRLRSQRAAAMYSLMVITRLKNIDPYAWFADLLGRIVNHPASRLD
jgi:hypothetical protein